VGWNLGHSLEGGNAQTFLHDERKEQKNNPSTGQRARSREGRFYQPEGQARNLREGNNPERAVANSAWLSGQGSRDQRKRADHPGAGAKKGIGEKGGSAFEKLLARAGGFAPEKWTLRGLAGEETTTREGIGQ